MEAVILAGGHGERLRVKGEYVPASLLPVGEKPLLGHQLAWLFQAGFDSAVLCLGRQAEAVRARFGDGSAFGLKLRYSVDERPLVAYPEAGLLADLGGPGAYERFQRREACEIWTIIRGENISPRNCYTH